MTRRGILPLYLALCLLLVAAMVGAIWYLKEARQSAAVSLLLKLKADYQMESAITMVMQKIRLQPDAAATDSLDLKSQEIAPGLVLSVLHHRPAPDVVRFEARVEGNGFARRLAAQATREILPDPGPASSVPEIVAAGAPRWYLEFLPEDGSGLGVGPRSTPLRAPAGEGADGDASPRPQPATAGGGSDSGR